MACTMTLDRRNVAMLAAGAVATLTPAAFAGDDLNENAKSAKTGYVGSLDTTAGNDASMAAIAARTTAKNEEAKRARLKPPPSEAELAAAQEEAKKNILLIAGGGTLASTAFFYKNLQRLFTKISTGGQDSG